MRRVGVCRTYPACLAAALVLLTSTELRAAAPPEVTVRSAGQAVIDGNDEAAARDRAINDALRNAVEQAAATLVSSETITVNGRLVGERILSQSKKYVRRHQITSERRTSDKRQYAVTMEATVSAADLEEDLDALKPRLSDAKLPQILLLVGERHVGQPGAPATPTPAIAELENAFIEVWLTRGFHFLDRKIIEERSSVLSAKDELSRDDMRDLARVTGASVVVLGKAVTTDEAASPGSRVHKICADVSLSVLALDSGRIFAHTTQSESAFVEVVDEGRAKTLRAAARAAALRLLPRMVVQVQSDLRSASTIITLTLSNLDHPERLKTISSFIKTRVQGVRSVRELKPKDKSTQLEIKIKGTTPELAYALEAEAFDGFRLEIDEFSASSVRASVK